MRVRQSYGFTLLEVLITLFILTILGVMITAGLRSILLTHERLEAKIKNLSQLQLAMLTIERDLQQFKNQTVNDTKNKPQPPFSLNKNSFTFTRGGFYSPNDPSQQRTLHSITYVLDGKDLTRISQVVDGDKIQGEQGRQILLHDLTNFTVQVIPKINPLTNKAPDKSSESKPPEEENTKVAVVIEMNIKDIGYIKRIIPLAVDDFSEVRNETF